jgi:two-component system sensor histidine kinase HydH
MIKGIVFVTVTGLLIFALGYYLLQRLSQQMEAIKRLDQQREAAENRTVTKAMVSSIAHDSNNMLASILFGADLLPVQGELNEKQQISARQIKKAAQQIRDLNSRLLSATRVESDLPLEAVKLSSILKQIRGVIKSSSKISDIPFVFNVENSDAKVKVNLHLLLQALQNIIHNAADAVDDDGKIEVKMRTDEETVYIEVHDNGPGVEDEFKAKIFHPFFSRKKSGHGLGLVAVKACAETFGGEIVVDKSHLGGACFRLSLPKVN